MSTGACPMCQAPVSWITVKRTASLLHVSDRRVRELISDGRLPGSVKFTPPGGEPAFWKVNLDSVAALLASRGAK